MATEFTPGGPVRRQARNYRLGRHWSTYVILALFVVVIVSGLVLTFRDDQAARKDAADSIAQTAPPAPVKR